MIDFSAEITGDEGKVLLVRVSGHLDSDSCEYFYSCLEDKIEQGHTQIVIDCLELEFVSSMGLGMLMRAHSRMKKLGGNVTLARLEGGVAEVFRVVGFDKLLRIYPTIQEALATYQVH